MMEGRGCSEGGFAGRGCSVIHVNYSAYLKTNNKNYACHRGRRGVGGKMGTLVEGSRP